MEAPKKQRPRWILKRRVHPVVSLFEPVVDAIAETLGKNCEVVLHDLTDLKHSIIKIANGDITGRKVGDPITDLGLKMVKSHSPRKNLCPSYLTKTKDGRRLKSNSVLIHDTKGKIVGALCINLDLSAYHYALDVLQQMCNIPSSGQELQETFENDVEKMLDNIIENVVAKKERSAMRIGPSEKLELIRELESRGVFLIKGAVKKVADTLRISSVSVYKYLDSIRKE